MMENNNEIILEKEWLKYVVNEARKQYEEKHEYKEKFRKNAIETQRELWQEVGSISVANGLEQLTDFFGYINIMKSQKRDHEVARKREEVYRNMIMSPYFGRIDFTENGDKEAEKIYIGLANLINDEYRLLIYDWRAPVSSMFYDYEIGEAAYSCPEGLISGKISLKRQYKIADGEMKYMFDSSLKIDDEILQDMLSKSTDTKMRTIITTIQREQNKIIRNEEYKNLIVQGPAGSGKTSVALHRIAYLLYKYRDKLKPQNIVIFSPNQIFNDYISDVLPLLGEDNMVQTTFMEFMHNSLGNRFKKETYGDLMEFIFSDSHTAGDRMRKKIIKYKTSADFMQVLKKYVKYVEDMNRKFDDIVYRENTVITSSEIKELFYKDYKQMPIKRRLQKIKERILFLLKPFESDRMNEISNELLMTGFYIDNMEVKEKSLALVKEETKHIYNAIYRMTDFTLQDIYKGLYQKLEIFYDSDTVTGYGIKVREMKKYTLENLTASILNYEDQIALLYLKGALGDLPDTSDIKYVIIDEAQDYSPLQYETFYQLFRQAGITMLGDINQSINPLINIGSYDNLADVFPQNETHRINLTKSYRSTIEIVEFSRKLLKNSDDTECVNRSGEVPVVNQYSDESQIIKQLVNDVNKYKQCGYKSIAIIVKTKKETKQVYEKLNGKIPVKAIESDDDKFTNDTIVIPAYLSKGLEFDVVLIYNANNEAYSSEDDRLLLYTACTRALHVLSINYYGKLSGLFN